MTHTQLMKLIRSKCSEDTQLAYAKELGVSPSYLCDILKGRREIGPKVLERMGMERVIQYRRLADERSI
jgi:DNA-binding transcriptional regulator YdaS (Cro superfamily)